MVEWLALAVGAAGLVLSIVNAWRLRHRVTVVCSSVETLLPNDDAERGYSYVIVRVRNVGRPTTVEFVEFEFANVEGEARHGVSWRSVRGRLAQARDGGEFQVPPSLPDLLESGYRLEDGDSLTWSCTLSDIKPDPDVQPSRGVYVAVAHLGNGRVVRSDPFEHAQAPDTGWPMRD